MLDRLEATNAATIFLQRLRFADLSAFEGGAVYLRDSSATVVSCTFERNHASQSGGAINADHTTTLVIEGSIFLSNTAGRSWGGAIYVGSQATLTISVSTFSSTADGLAIRWDNHEPLEYTNEQANAHFG
eukprot:SAG22_NODE_2739_length_2261_cov_1.708603_1_plen_130_part_00